MLTETRPQRLPLYNHQGHPVAEHEKAKQTA
jgi:hypothetical protein